jgi:UDP-N-acetylmuramyl pentapeptide phosphotransferase/UDP-N-acetylglucosamine-1-phosphate transferase
MNQFASYVILFILSFIGSIILIHFLINKLSLWGIVDKPDDRRAHTRVTPRGGGLFIVIIFTISFISFEYSVNNILKNSVTLIPIFLSIATISFLDDLKPINVFVRLIIHLCCTGLSVFLFLWPAPLFQQILPLNIDFIITVILFTAFLNIYNFLDGIDGMTATESIHLSITILILCILEYDIIINVDMIMIAALILLSCSISFLIFNWHPASIFLGDVGSISLGFLLGLCLLLISASSIYLFISSIIASLYYIADGGLTILLRLVNKEKIWEPHLQHFFQKAVKNGMKPQQIIKRVITCNFLLMLLAINALYYPIISLILGIFIVSMTLSIFIA